MFNLFKKVCSVLLSILLMTTVLPVLGATTISYEDNFDSQPTGSIAVATGYESDIWAITSANSTNTSYDGTTAFYDGTNTYVDMSIVEDTTVDKNLKIQFLTDSRPAITTESVTIGEGETVIFSFGFRLDEGISTNRWSFGVRGGAGTTRIMRTTGVTWYNNSGTSKGTMTKGAWHTAQFVLTQSAATLTIYDAEGTIKATNTEAVNMTTARFNIYASGKISGGTNIIYLDDSKLIKVGSADTVDYTKTISNIDTVNPVIDLTFDQPVVMPAEGSVTLTEAGSATAIACDVTMSDFYNMQITPSTDLVLETEYTLNLAAVQGVAGNAIAANKNSIVFKPSVLNPALVEKEDKFESCEVGSISLTDGYTSDVWAMTHGNSAALENSSGFSTTAGGDRISLTVVEEEGNQVMEVSQLLNKTGITSVSLPFNDTVEYDTVYTSFRFKIPTTTGSGQWRIGAQKSSGTTYDVVRMTGSSFFDVTNAGAATTGGVSYSKNTWYDALLKITPSSVAIYIYNENGLVYDNERTGLTLTQAQLAIHVVGASVTSPFTMMLDDSAIKAVNSADDAPRLASSSIANGEIEVSRQPVIDLTFDRPMAACEEGDITFSDDTNTLSVKTLSYNKVRVTFAHPLNFSTSYTLDFSGLTDILGNDLRGPESITFTTAYMPLSIFAPETPLTMWGSTVLGDTVTFPVINHTGEDLSAHLMLAFYRNDTLIATEQDDVVIADDATSVDFTVSGNYHDITSIRLMAFDNMTDLHPITEACEVSIYEDVPVYNLDRYKNELIFKQDFEGGTLESKLEVPGTEVTVSATYNENLIDSTTGYNSDNSYHISFEELMEDGTTARQVAGEGGKAALSYTIRGLNLEPGTGLVMSSRMKASNLAVTGEVTGLGYSWVQGCRSTMGIRDTSTSDATYIYKIDETISGNSDWIESLQYTVIKHAADTVSIRCYLHPDISQGEAWYDDISLYKVSFDPFAEAILETPVYKGFIYGENGVGDINLSTSVKDYKTIDLNDCIVRAKIVDAEDSTVVSATMEDVQEEIRISFSSKDLTMGEDYYLQLILEDSTTGEQYGFREWTLRKRPESYRPNNYFDEHGRFVVDGEPTFLMGIYGMNDLEETIDDLAGTPINVMVPYGYAWTPLTEDADGNPVASVDQSVLDYAEENGIKLVVTLKNHHYSKVISTNRWTNIITKPQDVRTVFEGFAETSDHPAVLGYYLADEIGHERYGAEVEWANRVLSNYDADGFTFNTFSSAYPRRTQLRYADTTNCSSYVISRGDGTENLSSVTNALGPIVETVPVGNRPFYGVLQSADVNNDSTRPPEATELRNMMYQAVCAGLQGIIWYNYFEMKSDNATAPFNETWPVLVDVCEELETYYPVILSTEAAPAYETDIEGDSAWFTSIAKRYNGKSYLFTTNTSREAKTAKIKVDGATQITGLYSGTTYTIDSEGWFTVNYPSIGVEVFEIVQADYSSPEHQLSSLGFYNGATSYFVAGRDAERTLYLPQNVSQVSYAAKISEDATLYLNGVAVSASGTVNLTDVETLTVKVVAEDTDFYSEYTYNVVRG